MAKSDELNDIFGPKKGGAGKEEPARVATATAMAESDEDPAAVSSPRGGRRISVDHGDIDIEIECVLGGALMRVKAEGRDPRAVLEYLRSVDPAVKFRDDFPRGGMGGGKRDTKLARAMTILVDVKDSGKYVDMVCANGDDIKVTVGKKSVDEWLPKLEALGKLTPKNLDKIKAAFESKKTATVMLNEEEQFGVGYFEIEGKCYLDNMQAEPPAAQAD